MKKKIAEFKKEIRELGPRLFIAKLIRGLGRVLLFLGFALIMTALIVFGMSALSGDSSSLDIINPDATSTSDGAKPESMPVVVSVLISIGGIVLVLALLGYMFYFLNRVTRDAVNLIAKHSKSSIIMLEISLTIMIYALAAALLASIEPDSMSAIFAACAIGGVLALASFVTSHLLSSQKPAKKSKK